jgi:DNA-binding HxlR family transcriptional regulator
LYIWLYIWNVMKQVDFNYPLCPVRNVLGRFSDKWSLLIMATLRRGGKLRYKEIMKGIPDISHKMLTTTLKKLEEDHLITRKAYAEIPPRVEYALTPMGESLMPALQLLIAWAQENFNEFTS